MNFDHFSQLLFNRNSCVIWLPWILMQGKKKSPSMVHVHVVFLKYLVVQLMLSSCFPHSWLQHRHTGWGLVAVVFFAPLLFPLPLLTCWHSGFVWPVSTNLQQRNNWDVFFFLFALRPPSDRQLQSDSGLCRETSVRASGSGRDWESIPGKVSTMKGRQGLRRPYLISCTSAGFSLSKGKRLNSAPALKLSTVLHQAIIDVPIESRWELLLCHPLPPPTHFTMLELGIRTELQCSIRPT